MKPLLLTLLLSALFISNQAAAQKIKFKDGIVTVDGVPYLKWKDLNSVEASLSSLHSEEEEIAASWLNYPDPARVSDANPQGLVRWIEVYFPAQDLRCEILGGSRKELIDVLLDQNIYVDGVLNAENVQKLVKRYGMRVTENRPGGKVNIIINNE